RGRWLRWQHEELAIAIAIATAIAITAPIETVVDPQFHHLDVAVPLDERVPGKSEPRTNKPNRSNKCPVVQPQEIILNLRRPIGRESPLDARAHQPAAVAVVGAGD